MIKQFLTILIISFISIASTKAQKIYVNTSSGTSIFYDLTTIDSIVFQNNQMIITLIGGTSDSYGMDSVRSYSYPNVPASGALELNSLNVQELKIYPNPNNGLFSVDYDLERDSKVEIVLFNLNGQQMFIQTLEQTAGEHHEVLNLNSQNLNSGIYFIELRTAKERFINKLSKINKFSK